MRTFSPGRALLLAGLFCFQCLHLGADELPPARSPLGGSKASLLDPDALKADLSALREEQAAHTREHAELLEEQARRLSRTAATLQDLQIELRTGAQSAKALELSVSGLNAGISSLDKRLGALSEAAAAKDAENAAQAAKVKGLSEDLGSLKLLQESSMKQMKDGLAEVAALRDDLKQRQAMLASLTDLLNVIKKDVDSNSEEIVEVKQALKLYEKAPEKKAEDEGEWWDQALRWKYLPALAVGLSAVAVGLAATKR